MRFGQVFVTAHFLWVALGAPEFKLVAAALIEELGLILRAEDGVNAVIVEFVDEADEAMGGIVHVLVEYGYAGDEYVVKAACYLHKALVGAGGEAEGIEIKSTVSSEECAYVS